MDINDYREMDYNTAAGEAMYPKLYHIAHPFVMQACDEMESRGVMMPTKHMLYRVCEQTRSRILGVYPEMTHFDVEYEDMADDDPPPTPGGLGRIGQEFGRMFPGESTPSSLDELRRRHPMEFEDFRRRHPESFRRGSMFRDFLQFLILLEFFRRRGR